MGHTPHTGPKLSNSLLSAQCRARRQLREPLLAFQKAQTLKLSHRDSQREMRIWPSSVSSQNS